MNQTDLEKLEYPKIQHILSEYCTTYLGKEFALTMHPSNCYNHVQKLLLETCQARELLMKKPNFPLGELPNLNVLLQHLSNSTPISARCIMANCTIFENSSFCKRIFL